MTAPMSATLIEIGVLDRARPTLDAPVAVLAGWYEQKAVVLHHIADTASPTERDLYQRWADQAHDHAVRLHAGPGGGAR